MHQVKQGKTKVVCTLGPSSNTVEALAGMIHGGMDVARLNFSHGSYDDHLTMMHNVREAARRTGEEVTILQDLQGPKIRVGKLDAPFITLQQGRRVVLATGRGKGDETTIPTTYEGLTRDVHAGDSVLLDDGRLRLRVLEVKESGVICEVLVGGKLSSHKGINLPGVSVSAPSFTGKDLHDLEFGIEHDIDYVALSFVRTADDVRELREAIVGRIREGRYLPIIAKIEKPQAVANIDAIIAEADGVMIARGDLGVELPPEDVPLLQKMIVAKCNREGKPVIIATQMLESMISNPTPTRAETSDVANAVLDGGDAVMLSGETSVGAYPFEAVQMMERIITKVESERTEREQRLEKPWGTVENRHDALGRAACVLAEQMAAAAIVCVTFSGHTARVVSQYRPRPRIIAVTNRAKILRRLQLIWGVRGMVIDDKDLERDSDRTLDHIQRLLVNSGMVMRGDYIVVLAGQPLFARGSTNFIKVERVM